MISMTEESTTPWQDVLKQTKTAQSMSVALSHRFEDMVALQRLPGFPNDRFLPWTRSALRPSTILVLLQEIELHQHAVIVELGSGISTLYISRLLQGSNRRLLSVDNDAGWQEVVRKQATDLGLSTDPVSFIHAPLADYADQQYAGKWYDLQSIRNGLGDVRIDCLLVDGPQAKATENPRARYPALPALCPYMNDNYVVYLDDCNRPGEQSIAKDWSNAFNLDGLFLPERGNVCLLHPAGAKRFNVV
jgi:predicted O-methyltransferase YrrM